MVGTQHLKKQTEKSATVVTLMNGQSVPFPTLREGLLYSWDKDPANVKKIKCDGETVMLQEDIWK